MKMRRQVTMLSFLIVFVLLTPNLVMLGGAVDAPPDPVLDITGKKILTGTRYYILPVFRGRGGGLTLASATNVTCPLLDVVQAQSEVDNGLPLTFAPVNSTKRGSVVVRVFTDLNIKFSAATICVQSTVWKIGDFDETSGKYPVTSGGVEGNPGPRTISNWFKIEKYGSTATRNDYKLVFCPTVCNFCKVVCRDVGVTTRRRLALVTAEEAPFIVMFKKA